MGSTGNVSTYMGLSSAASGISSFGSAYAQSQALKTQGEYQKQQYDTNARLSEMAATDAIKRGEKEAESHRKKTNQVVGSQRAALAAQGINVDSGSAAAVQKETKQAGKEDIMAIRNNAWKEAWGFRVQANNYSGQGAMAELAGRTSSRNTLLTGGMQAASGLAQSGSYFSQGYSDNSYNDREQKLAAGRTAARNYWNKG